MNSAETEEKNNVNDIIVQAMLNLHETIDDDPCKHDIEVMAESLKQYGVRKPEHIWKHENDNNYIKIKYIQEFFLSIFALVFTMLYMLDGIT